MDVEKTMEFLLGQQVQIHAMQMKAEEHFARNDRDIDKIKEIPRRAVRLAVQEARAERERRREADEQFDLKMDQLAAAHLITEEKFQKLVEKMDRYVEDMRHPGGNGNKK